MNIKSLLLGSAAALVAVSGAKAADAVVTADPEPVEYVRVCDAYGAGYYYVPGTETCMRISGYVRADLKGGDNVGARYAGQVKRDTYAWRTRAALRFHTASETELGTLRTFVELRSQWDGGAEYGVAGDETQLRFAYIELGGLRVGMDESIFNHWTGYFGSVANDDIVNKLAYSRTNVISYTFNAGNGLSGIIGVEQGNESGDFAGSHVNRYWDGTAGAYQYIVENRLFGQQVKRYAPHVVAGLKYAQGWGSLSAVAAYDAVNYEWAAKIRADVNVTDEFSVWAMAGYKSMDDYYAADATYGVDGVRNTLNADGVVVSSLRGVSRQITSVYGDWGGSWSAWTGGKYKFAPSTSFNYQISYDATRTLAASVNVSHAIVPGLTITPELTYVKWNDKYGYSSATVNGVVSPGLTTSLKGQDAFQATIRLQRSF